MSSLINLHHLLGATCHSLDGLRRAWRGEQAFRHECIALFVLITLLFMTDKSVTDWLLVIGAWLVVMVVELLNSAIEEIFNLISTEWNPRIKDGKDLASAAIFLAMLLNAGIWIHVFC